MADIIFKGVSKARDLFARMKIKTKRKRTLRDVMEHAVAIGRGKAQRSAPFLTGRLRSNIQGQVQGEENDVRGWLEVDLGIVPYARRQNFEHKSHANFMTKGTLEIQREVLKYWDETGNVEDFVFNE